MSLPISKAFALTPSHHQTNYVLILNDKDDIKYYLRVVKPLFSEREDKLECTTENLKFFLQALDERSQEYIWDYNDT